MGADFPEHWQLKSIEETMDALIDYRGKTPKKTVSGIPLITAKIVKSGRIHEPSEFIAEDNYDSWMVRGFPEVGDVVVTTEAPLGEVAQIKNSNIALAQRIVTLRGKKGLLNNDFLLYAMQSGFMQHQLESRASGSTVKGIKQSELRKVLVPIPPVNEQIEIAKHLKSIDSKIELNYQINQTLESMAQTIFKSWFVDFEPVKAKIAALEAGEDAEGVTRAAMRAISGKTDDELNQMQAGQPENYARLKTTAGLFPAGMQDSELGGVPEGWEVREIGDVVKVVGGGTPSTKNSTFWDGGSHCWTTPKDLSGMSSPVLLDTIRKITDAGLAKISCGLLPAGTFLLSSRAPVGYTSIAQIPLAVNQGYIAIPPGGQLSSIFLLHWTHANLETIKGRACGTTFQEISKKNFRPIKITVPTAEILTKFDRAAGSLFERIVANEQESRSLTVIRDALLPKLMSGKIWVK